MKKVIKKSQNFDSLSIKLASPDEIMSWSFGEVTLPETIDYRTQRLKPNGLFCEKIFGTEKDFQCSCGKYKGSQYQGIVCSNCGVEVSKAIVRRERMGHIDLAVPIAHFWYLKKVPSRIAILLGLPAQKLQNVIYFSSHYITKVNEKKRKSLIDNIKKEFDEKLKQANQPETQKMLNILYEDRMADLSLIQEDTIIEEVKYERLIRQFPDFFKAEKGGEVVYNLLKNLNLKEKEKEVKAELEVASNTQKEKLQKQLLAIRSFLQSGNKPEWMFLTRLPVIPPGLRPVLLLDSGQPASSDLNDLYRGILIRNNRLKEFIQRDTPQIFINTEKRLLQESVDALFDKAAESKNNFSVQGKGAARQLKPISEYLSGKTGYFRSNLLGKRVDFSGRSVIVAGSHLKLDEFGLPKKMALEIFRPFVVSEMLELELAFNVRGAQRIIDLENSIVWEILEKVIQGKYMLLNRHPTLHRQSIQAFKPILIEGLAIELPPLVCSPFNADFDGDAMTTHLPLSEEAQAEAREIMVSSRNMITPATGEVNASPATQDILLGCYWVTEIKEDKGEKGRYFGSISEAITAYDFGIVGLRTKIKVLASSKEKYGDFKNKVFETTVGRLLFNNILPKEYKFVNEAVDKKLLNKIIQEIVATSDRDDTPKHMDAIKDFGFKYASKSGITFSWEDLKRDKGHSEKIKEGHMKSKEINNEYEEGYISLAERKNKNIELWQDVKKNITKGVKDEVTEDSSIGGMIRSGARGSFDDLGEITGIFGIVESASGESIEQPILSSLKDGMSTIEYFNASFGARKGVVDTSLKTADAGFLSRKLFSVAQEIRIEGKDCKAKKGFRIYRQTSSGVGADFSDRIRGRFASEDVVDGKGEVVVKKNKYIDIETAKQIENEESILSVEVRSPITCEYAKGICATCYGEDRTTREVVDLGESVGTTASQSVGEPGTQLTMRTFHTGGVATALGDITAGLPRVTDVFERRTPKSPAAIAHVDGVVVKVEDNANGSKSIHINTEEKKASTSDKIYTLPPNRFIQVKVGDEVKKGQFLSDGYADLQELLKYTGKEKTQEYIFSQITEAYELQGVNIAPAHFEIIIRQMFSQLLVTDPGDANFIAGETIELSDFVDKNAKLKEEGKKLIKADNMVSGISSVSTSRNNFLSAASFQNTTNVLIKASLNGAVDTLDGVKENIIVGRLVPIGSGFEGSKKNDIIKKVKDSIAERLAEKEESQS